MSGQFAGCWCRKRPSEYPAICRCSKSVITEMAEMAGLIRRTPTRMTEMVEIEENGFGP